MSDLSQNFRRTVVWAAAASVPLAFLALLLANLAVGGRMTVRFDLRNPAPFVLGGVKPNDRLQETSAPDGQTAAAVLSSPIYIDLRLPIGFETVRQSLRYRPAAGASLELGAMASPVDRGFAVRLAGAPLIDGLDWPRSESGGLLLLDRTGRYASPGDFLESPPDRSRIAVWGTEEAIAPFRPAGYRPADAPWEREITLRGSHRFLAYVSGETLSLTLTVQDMNREPGNDPAVLTVFAYGGSEPLAQSVLADDGNILGDQSSSPLRTLSVSAHGLPAGTYQVEFTATDDVFIRKVRSAQRYLALSGRIHLGDFVGYSDSSAPTVLWAGGRRLSAAALNAAGRQGIAVGGASLPLTEPSVPESADLPPGRTPVRISSPERQAVLRTDGTFALTESSWFNPRPLVLDSRVSAADLDLWGIDFILAGYCPPERNGDSLTATAEFRADSLARTPDGAWRFMIDVAGDGALGGETLLEEAVFSFRRPAFGPNGLFAGLRRIIFGDREGEWPAVRPDIRLMGEFPE